MAQGDIVVFAQAKLDIGDKLHNLSTDSFYVGLVDNTTVPSETTADPRWGAGGTTNFKANEVTPGGNYAADGATIGAADHWTLSGATATFDGADVSWLQHASNPTNAYWGILYNSTDAGKRCIAYIDLGGVFDMTTGDLEINFNASGIFTKA